MDTITHGLLGAAAAQLGFRQRLGPAATWMAAGAAILPDLDVLVQPLLYLSGAETDDFSPLVHHRGLSHSLLILPLAALAIAWLWRRYRRNGGRPAPLRLLYACVLVGLLAHPLLDWCTSYGTQLFAPLTQRRFALDVVPIVDIFYTPLLILTLMLCWAIRRARLDRRHACLIVGWTGFLLSLAYLAAGGLCHHRAGTIWRDHAPPPRGPAEYRAYPQIGAIFLWRVTRRDDDAWTVARVNVVFGGGRPADLQRAPLDRNPWIDRARELPDVQTYDWFAMGQTRAVHCLGVHGHVVEFHDMRYGREPSSLDSMWPLAVHFDHAGRVIGVERLRNFHQRRFADLARRAWGALWQP